MKTFRIAFAVLALAFGSTGWGQSVFLKYGPVAGIQKSTGSTYQNTAAASSDVIGLWSGCSGANFLRGDGTCAVPAGTGVTSVAVPAPLTATSCSGGACVLSWTTGQTANQILATPNGSTGAVSLRALVGADVPPTNLATTTNGGVLSTSILAGTNGGTSNGFMSFTGPTTSLKTFTLPNASATILTSNAAVTVPQGGTGLATLTANGVLLGEGTGNVNPLVMGADTVLRGTASADPVAAAVPNCGSATTALSYNTTTHAFGCQTITSGGTGTVTNVATGTGLTGGPITSTGTLSVDQSAALSWSALETFTANGTNGAAVAISSANPGVSMNVTGAGVDQKNWRQIATTTDLVFDTRTDANGAGRSWLDVARGTGAAVGTITLGNTTDNPVVSLAGGQLNVTGKNGTGITCTNSSAVANSTAFCLSNNTTGGHTMWTQVVSPTGGANNELGLFIDGGTGPNSTDTMFRVDASGGTVFKILGDGTLIGFGNSRITQGPAHLIWATISTGGGTCTVLSSNYVTGCTRSAAGSYSIPVSAGIGANNMACSATLDSGAAAGLIIKASGSSTAITISLQTTAGVGTDANYGVICTV